MEQLLYDVIEIVKEAPHFWVFLILFLSGLGLPIPEEVTLIAAAWATVKDWAQVYPMFITAILAILCGDLATYTVGRVFGYRLVRLPYFRRILSERRLRKVDQFFEHYGEWTVFIARFFAGIRFACYFIAGITRLKIYIFILMDLLAALLSVGLTFWFIRRYGQEIEKAIGRIHRVHHLVIIILVAAVILFAVYRIWKSRREREQESASDSVERLSIEPAPMPNENSEAEDESASDETD